jgi:hypothetical protein
MLLAIVLPREGSAPAMETEMAGDSVRVEARSRNCNSSDDCYDDAKMPAGSWRGRGSDPPNHHYYYYYYYYYY